MENNSCDRRYEYDGEDIKGKVSDDAFIMILAIRNHLYDDYDTLKLYVNAIIKNDENSIPYMLDSLTDIDLRSLERLNPLANQGHNKRVFDYVSLICAIKDNGYDLTSLKNSQNLPLYWANLNTLYLNSTGLGDKSIQYFLESRMPKLKSLNIIGNRFSNNGRKKINELIDKGIDTIYKPKEEKKS